MKKLILSLVAMFTMTFAMAQTSDNSQSEKRQRMDPKEMIQKRTQQMVEQYGLNSEQATKLQALNEKYMAKMGGPRGPRGKKPGEAKEGSDNKEMKDGERPEPPKDMQQGGDSKQKGNREQEMKEYEEGIKAILTADQYKAYQADEQKRQAERKNHKGGPREKKSQE